MNCARMPLLKIGRHAPHRVSGSAAATTACLQKRESVAVVDEGEPPPLAPPPLAVEDLSLSKIVFARAIELELNAVGFAPPRRFPRSSVQSFLTEVDVYPKHLDAWYEAFGGGQCRTECAKLEYAKLS